MQKQEVLALGPEVKSAKTISETCTKSLWDCLQNGLNAKDAAETIFRDELLLAECKRAYPEAARLAAKVGRDGVFVALQPLLILFGAPDFGEGAANAALKNVWIELYADALHKLPAEALEHAVSQWIAFGKPFFPKPTELNALAKARAEQVWLIAWRMRVAVEHAEKETPIERTPEEMEEVKRMSAETIALLRSKAAWPGTRPTVSRAALAAAARRHETSKPASSMAL